MTDDKQVRISIGAGDNADGKGHYYFIDQSKMKEGDVIWDEEAHIAKWTPKTTKKTSKKK